MSTTIDNPFDGPEEDHSSSAANTSSNPFDDDVDTLDQADVSVGKTQPEMSPFVDADVAKVKMTQAKVVSPAKLPIQDVKRSSLSDKVPLPVMVRGCDSDTHKITLTQAAELLNNVGFLPELVKASLYMTGDVVASFNTLSEKVTDVCLRDQFGTASTLWKAPIAVRIGSWMPRSDPVTGSDFTEYYISVTNVRSGESYQIAKRYSEFHALYLSLYSHLVNSFAKGMQNLFPDNRVTTWFARESDQLRNSRREYLDGFLREVCLNALVMINLDARDKIYDFLEINQNLRIPLYKR